MKKAVCVLVKVGSGYLVVTRPNSNLYGLVGGKVDGTESTLQAIVREVKEEVGLDFDPAFLKEVFTEVCPGEVDYLTTTFTYPDFDESIVHSIKTEPGLTYGVITKNTLCNEQFSPFAQYNKNLFEKISTLA